MSGLPTMPSVSSAFSTAASSRTAPCRNHCARRHRQSGRRGHMRPDDYLLCAFAEIWSAKLRSFLTSLGVIIGVAAVVLILAISAGLSANLTGAFAGLGSTRVLINPSPPRPEGAG